MKTGSTLMRLYEPPNRPRMGLSAAECKAAQISRLYDCCLYCRMCELGQIVHLDGQVQFDPHVFSTMTLSRICVVGQNPGVNECARGEPFVGQAGANFDQEVRKHGVDRDRFYITNAVKCHTPANRAPTPAEIGACALFLQMELQILRPRLIVTLGAVAFSTLCPGHTYTERLGCVTPTRCGRPAFAIYHPSPRNLEAPARRAAFERQIAILCAIMARMDSAGQGDTLEPIS
jgi:uracil-DNA glycosylase family 4